MAQKWFVQIDDRIDGPLTSQDIASRLQAGEFNTHHLVWGMGMEHWRSLSWWSSSESESHTQTMNVREDTVTEIREVWHYALNGESHGPFQREILISELKKIGSLADVLLWTKGMKEWAPLFEFHEVLTSLGVNKRQFPRADISGQVTIKTNTGQTLVAPALTISEGGLGVQLDSGLTAGMNVTVEITSPAFKEPVHAKAEVRFLTGGNAGLRFTSLNNENKGAIISFVRQSQTRFVLKAS